MVNQFLMNGVNEPMIVFFDHENILGMKRKEILTRNGRM